MNCLLCQESIVFHPRFLDILLIKKEQPKACLHCYQKFEPISSKHCPYCFKSEEDGICLDCRIWQEKGKTVSHHSLFRYNSVMADFMSSYKFRGDYLLRYVFSKALADSLGIYKNYTLVPIPLSDKGLEKRKFNQVTAMLSAANLSYQELLGKYETSKQSSKSKQERLNLCQPFYLKQKQELPDKIVLVDDVYTTGATLALAKELLEKAGVQDVKTFSLAR